ncbi:hypothetical protein DF276_15670, partial [Listeria monocytogenes]
GHIEKSDVNSGLMGQLMWDLLLMSTPSSRLWSQADDLCILLALLSFLVLQALVTGARQRKRINKKGCQPRRLDFGSILTVLPLVWCFCRLENCHLTEACCKELSSTLIVNQRLTYLCLANNKLGDGGVKLLCEGLSYPECQLQTLV